MPTFIKFAVKDINPDRLHDELVVAGIEPEGVLFAGFHPANNRLTEPFTATEVIATATGKPDVTADPGELHFRYPSDPGVALDTVLTNHVATNLSIAQTNEDRDETAAIAHINAFNNWDSLNATQRNNANKQAQRSLARIFNSSTDI